MQIAVLAILTVLASSAASLLFKASTQTSGGGFIENLMTWQFLLGVGLFGGAALLYVMLLQRLPLSAAQSFMAAQYIVVAAASVFILGEAMPLLRLAGIILIASGIVLVSVTL